MRRFSNGVAVATILCGASVLALAPAAHANLLINGSFEQAPVVVGDSNGKHLRQHAGRVGNASWDTWTSIPGWTAGAGDAIEIQTKNTVGVTPQDGDYYVELDAHPQARANSLMFQAVTSSAGSQTLSYYYRPRTETAGDNGIRVYLNGNLQASLTADGPPNPPSGQWTLISALVNLTAGSNEIRFEAFGTSNTYGGFIDNVVLTPIPAAAWLFGSAFLGLCWLGRRNATGAVGMLPRDQSTGVAA